MVVKRETREQARQLRAQGISVVQIAKELGVSKGSVSHWVRDIELTKAWQEEGKIKAREGHLLHMTGCMLYWAEGAKRRNRIHFVNSDPAMMQVSIRFLRDELHVADENIALFAHCHSQDIEEQCRIQRYWLNILNLKTENLRSVYVKKGSNSRKNILVNGVCPINVNSTHLTMHIYGAIQEYCGFERPEWLFS